MSNSKESRSRSNPNSDKCMVFYRITGHRSAILHHWHLKATNSLPFICLAGNQ